MLVLVSILLLIFINTRTIGIIIIPAIVVVLILDRSIPTQIKRDFSLAVFAVTLIWLAWKYAYFIEGSTSYFDIIKPSLLKSFFNSDNDQAGLKQILRINIENFPYAWNQYISLSLGQSYFPILSLGMLVAAQICVVIRAVKLKLDALYISFYFLVLIFWPFPINDRFIHPVVILLLLQPLLLIGESNKQTVRKTGLLIYSASMVLMLVNSLFVQGVLLDRKTWAFSSYQKIGNYRELYSQPDTKQSIRDAKFIDQIIKQAQSLKELVPERQIVSANKPVFIALLADRTTIPLKTNISMGQQLCNLKLKSADFVYFSELKTSYTPGGLSTEKLYEQIIDDRYVAKESGIHVATLARLDKNAISKELESSGFNCEKYRLFQDLGKK